MASTRAEDSHDFYNYWMCDVLGCHFIELWVELDDKGLPSKRYYIELTGGSWDIDMDVGVGEIIKNEYIGPYVCITTTTYYSRGLLLFFV